MNASADEPSDPGGWTGELLAAAAALRELARAQVELLGAELRLARGAARQALATTMIIVVLVLAVGFSLLALLAVVLAQWLGSWPLALLVMVVVQVLVLALALHRLRRCLHWMSLPQTRAQWRALATAAPDVEATRERNDAPRRAA